MLEFALLLAIPILLVMTVREFLACLAWASEDLMDDPKIQEIAEWAGYTGAEAKGEPDLSEVADEIGFAFDTSHGE